MAWVDLYGIAGERGLLVGMVSMADAPLGRSVDSQVQELRLAEEVARALAHPEGELGGLLSMAESIKGGDVEKFEPELLAYEFDDDAYVWAHGLT